MSATAPEVAEVDTDLSLEALQNDTARVSFHALYPLIGFSLFMFVVCMTIFGFAVDRGLNRLFAPRSWARPKEIVKNQIKKPYCWSWIPWALKLSYSEMLEGVEGTGTRNKGYSGTKLRCNLDGIVLIKFVNLCLKVSVLATILCVGIVLPINYTSQCIPEQYDNVEQGAEICAINSNATSFEKTTFYNIPELPYDTNSTWYSPDLFRNAFVESTGITLRMITMLCVCFAIYGYTCVLIWEEWIENLALRRVYYLEYDHYEHRKEELEYIENLTEPEDIETINRPIFVVHPENRDTVPNIGLYSVLFRLPGVQLDDDLSCATNTDVGRQLQLAIEFFDKVVPNQPGYTSSIAALTILPDVKRLSRAWSKWFECASKVRRLKFIRKRIKELQEEQNLGKTRIEESFNREIEGTVEHFNGIQSQVLNTPERRRELDSDDTPRKRRSRNACTKSDLEASQLAASVFIKEESHMEMFLEKDEIEQMSVYYREFSRSSASCGPNGCDEYAILKADALTLADLEQEAAEEVSDAIRELDNARIQIRADDSMPEIHETPSCGSPTNSDLKDYEEVSIDEEACESSNTSHLWKEAEKLVGAEQYMVKFRGKILRRKLHTGSWRNPFDRSRSSSKFSTSKVVEKIVPSGIHSKIVKSESYAVVTFTSRQAAIAARQCLSDGSGLEGWREVDKIPVPPLADAVPWNICDCRGCCRPVTVTLPPQERRLRFKIVVVVMIIFSTIWTYPFFLFTNYTSPEMLQSIFKDVPNIEFISEYLSPWLTTGVTIAFFAVLPQIFKMLANFAGNATSIQEAERHALVYYWWFMLVFVFGGKTLGAVVWSAFQNNQANLSYGTQVLEELARIVPTTQSFYWITWMISQTGIILPFMYFLQFNNFMFTTLGWDCCARATAGGGPGGVVPYRVYVNSGVIFVCVVALSPLCPMVAPFCMLFFLFITPLLKWGFIFVYRPTFDAGGSRWPLLHRILMASIIVSQVIISLSFFLKKAFLVFIISLVSIIPTWTFKTVCEDTFEQSYDDAALLQTSELDGWSVNESMSITERERYRKWIVDCHKAAFVPVCVNAEDNFLTSEPAVVIPTERDLEDQMLSSAHQGDSHGSRDQSSASPSVTYGRQRTSTFDSYNSFRSSNSKQRGALFRRVTGTTMLHIPVGDHNSVISEECESLGSATSFDRQIEGLRLSRIEKEEEREKDL